MSGVAGDDLAVGIERASEAESSQRGGTRGAHRWRCLTFDIRSARAPGTLKTGLCAESGRPAPANQPNSHSGSRGGPSCARFGRRNAARLATRELSGRLGAARAAARGLARRGGAARDFERRTTLVVGALGQIALRRAVSTHARRRRADGAIDAVRFGLLRLRLAAADLLFRPVPFSSGCHTSQDTGVGPRMHALLEPNAHSAGPLTKSAQLSSCGLGRETN